MLHAGFIGYRVAAADRRAASFGRFLTTDIIPHHPSGFTIDPFQWSEPMFGADQYLVSLAGFELRTVPEPCVAEVCAWVIDSSEELFWAGRFAGGWLDVCRREFCLDVTIAVTGRLAAERVGRANAQMTIFHPATRKGIALT